MRFMQYRLQLDDDAGYIISNTAPSTDGGVNPEQVQEPGIKMFIEDTDPSVSELLEKEFEFKEDNWQNPEFRACYQQALRGEPTDWKLVTVRVSFGYLALDFVNEKLYQNFFLHGDTNLDDPYYSEVVYFCPRNESSYAKLRFEVENPGRKDADVFCLTMAKHCTKITERINCQQCDIEFLPPTGDHASYEQHHQWVNVWCYC